MSNEIYEEHKLRAPNQTERILKLLIESGESGVLNVTLSNISLRYGGLIHNLEREGWDISKENKGDGLVLYKLHGNSPTNIVDNRSGLEVIKEEFDKLGSVSFQKLVELMDENGLHIKHRPFGVKKRMAKELLGDV